MIEVKNAIIEKSTITTDDHGFLSAWLFLDYGGLSQGFGGYVLYLPKPSKHYRLHTVAGHFLWRVMEMAAVTSWDKLPGKTIRVRLKDRQIVAIGHIVKDIWFCPKEEFADEN